MKPEHLSEGVYAAPGILYGIGVGPGAPDLISLRAVAALRDVQVILAAASTQKEHSLALSIALPHLPPEMEILRLDFPMIRDKDKLEQAWARNARKTAEVLRSGRNAAFLTLGDPLIYSTFGYLMETLRKSEPDLRLCIVPGITSYQEAAARTGTVLCQGDENLLLIPGIKDEESLARDLALADSAVILKAYRNREAICRALEASGRGKDVRFASRLGLEGERTARGLENVPEKPHYLSLLLSPPPNDRRHAQGETMPEQPNINFNPDFAKGGGLLPAVAQDASTGEVLMLAYMNEESFQKTLESGEAHYWSRSRQSLWHKGDSSGHVQKVVALRLDCDSDAIVLLIEQVGGAACHEGYRSCFSREWREGRVSQCCPRLFDPKEVYK